MPISDPAPAPASEELAPRMKSSDLVNVPCILLPRKEGTWGPDSMSPGKPFIDCDVWTLDRSGVVAEEHGVRFSWWKAVDQLSRMMGQYVACRPIRNDDNSIELASLSGPARDVAVKVVDSFAVTDDGPPPVEYDDPDEDPF